MSYPEAMQESIKILEKTREKRRKQKISLLSLKERGELIETYHPQHKEGTQQRLKVGVNKEKLVPNEIADLFESKSLIDPEKIDLTRPDYETDVLVVGGGGGGASATLLAKENGAEVMLITKLRFGDSNTIMSEGGIQAAVDEFDSLALHYIDTMGGGGFANTPKLVKALVLDAPEVLQWLVNLGVMFDRTNDRRNILSSFAGGQCRRRVHSCADYSGLDIMRNLKDEVYSRGIEVIEFLPAVELILDDKGTCCGVVAVDLETEKKFVIIAKAVVLATGGSGRLHYQRFPTTNHYGATGDGLVMANKAGAEVIFLDAIQFHPTGTLYPEHLFGLLVTEAFRGWGAQLVNSEGERFINELEKRDITSSAIIREVDYRKKGMPTLTGKTGVWLDTPLVDIVNGEGTIKRIFPHLYHRFKKFGIDIIREPLLVYPTIHYQNGGILINPEGESSVKDLFAAGEISGGVHGRNRLGGTKRKKIGQLSLQHIVEYEKQLERNDLLHQIPSLSLIPDYRFGKSL